MTSCSSIESELAALRADIAALDNKYILKSEKNGIVNESIKGAELLIVPLFGTIVATATAPLIKDIGILNSLGVTH